MEAFEAFKTELESHGYSPVINMDADVDYIVTKLYPEYIKIITKLAILFDDDHVIMGVNLSEVFNSKKIPVEKFWALFVSMCISTVFYGDFKTKIGSLLTMARQYFFLTENDDSEIAKILNNEKAEQHFTEFIDFITNTRLANLALRLVEKADIGNLGIDFEKPADLVEMMKNRDDPKLKKIIEKFQNLLKDAMKRGEITQAQLLQEVQMIKAKLASIFGSTILDALGGGNGGVSSADLMGNSPEARRQRMLARLQKKQREKNSQ